MKIYSLIKLTLSSFLIVLLYCCTFLLPFNTATAQDDGVAPVLIPSGGLAIDGDLLARTPTTPDPPFSSSVGDFLVNTGASGTGGGVFTNPGGLPIDPSTSFHIIDGWSAAPGSTNPDVNSFTGGSKFNENPNSWAWSTSKPTPKDDINNTLFHFGYDASGNIWFMGTGDRFATNGTSYIDFELLQNTLVMNADGTFSSAGPDGGRTLGDLVISVLYSNGGSNTSAEVFRWVSTGPGTFGYQLFTPAAGTVYTHGNFTAVGPVPVPFGAFGSTTYPTDAFAECAVNITDVIPGLNECIGIKTVLVKTKASDALTAELKDLVTPVQVHLGTKPIVAVNSPTICAGGSATLTATVTFPLVGNFSYLWSPGGATTPSITVSPSSTTNYIVLVTDLTHNCVSDPDTARVTVRDPLPCSITGSDGPLCPSSTSIYTAPAGMATYSWSITGNGTIPVPSTDQSVTVTAGALCNQPFTLTLNITDVNGCSSTCDKTVNVNDVVAPTISGVGAGQTIECPASPVFSNPTASDACDANPTLTFNDVNTPGTCPQEYSVTRTWTATDACGNSSQASQTITVEDNTAPVISGVGGAQTIECPASPQFSNPTAADLCDPSPTLTFNDVNTPGTCPQEYSVTRTWTATDACGNSSQASQTITVEDNTAPVLANMPVSVSVACNQPVVLGYPTATDLCDQAPVVSFSRSDGGQWGDPYLPGTTTTVCFWATDACGNASAQQCITVTVATCVTGHIFPTATACCNYINPIGLYELQAVCYTTKVNKVSNAIPGVFFYYTYITAPSANFTIDVTQTKDCATFKYFALQQNNQIRLYTDGCSTVPNTVPSYNSTTGTASIAVTGAIPGNVYVLSAKYDVKAIIGSTFGNCGFKPTVNYTFVSNIGGVPQANTDGYISAVPDCTDNTPVPPSCGKSEEVTITAPETQQLNLDVYPNPFNTTASVKFSVPESGHVSLEVYSLIGAKIATLYDGNVEANEEYIYEFKGEPYINQATYIVVVKTDHGSKYQRLIMNR